MKVYIKSATNISDVQAKIAKKQAEIDKKLAWIQKKEAAIQKKLALLSSDLTSEELRAVTDYVNALKVTRSHKVPDELRVDLYGLVRKYGWQWGEPKAEALYNIDNDAESIFNSNEAIKEAQAIIDNYNEKISALRAKGEELDRIPECLKEFMNSIIAKWDEYDLRLKNESQPYYKQLKEEADAILYKDNPYHISSLRKERLAELYPNIEETDRYRSLRESQFEKDHIIKPFEMLYGPLNYARSFWYMSDEQIHKENQKAGENLILDLLKRVTKITGPVTDWSGLHVTQGNMGAVLNGIVVGDEGKARVESILAGGYNIQRLHVRTLVKEIH